MNLFSIVKANISTREAAEHYGIEVNRQGKALCPFHNDHRPSLLVADDHYHCFACSEHGDSIDLVAKLFDLPLYEAAQKLAADFGLPTDKPLTNEVQNRIRKKTEAQQLRENERLCFSVLNDYRRVLEEWKENHKPSDWRWEEACRNLDYVNYLLDELLQGDSWERADVVQEVMQGGKIFKLQERLRKLKEESAFEYETTR